MDWQRFQVIKVVLLEVASGGGGRGGGGDGGGGGSGGGSGGSRVGGHTGLSHEVGPIHDSNWVSESESGLEKQYFGQFVFHLAFIPRRRAQRNE